jgi:predicted kinase
MKILISIGLPGSGKSTYIQQLNQNDDYMVVSKDQIRQMLYATYNYKEEDEPMIKRITQDIIENERNS